MFRTRSFRLAALLMLVAAIAAACAKSERKPVGSVAVSVDERQKIERLNSTAEELYQTALTEDLPAARNRLESLSVQITHIEFYGVTGVEGMKALSEAVVAAKRLYNGVSVTRDDAVEAAGKIRLATDALTHPNQPMWHQYNRVIEEMTVRLESAVQHKNKREAVSALNDLKQKYQLFRPALFISRAPSDIERLDSLFLFLSRQLNSGEPSFGDVVSAVKHLDESFAIVFGNKDRHTAAVPLAYDGQTVLWTFGLAGIIVTVLSLVGWRMFHSDKSLARVPRDGGKRPWF